MECNNSRSNFQRLAKYIAALLLGFSSFAAAQSLPSQPQQLCIQETGDCAFMSIFSDDNELRKWNPGHYLKTQGNHATKNKSDYVASVTSQLAKTRISNSIRGAEVHYAWGMLEPRLGEYDWAPVYEHLNYLSGHGKKLIVMVSTKCFENDCGNLAPKELDSQIHVSSKESPTSVIEIWESPNMRHLIAFWQAFAEEFDGHPALEIVSGSESTASLNGEDPSGFSKSGYASQLKRMYIAQASAFKNTNVIANINYLSNQLAGLMEQAYQVKIGRGMPDTKDSFGSLIFRGDCYDEECGKRDYRGKVAHMAFVSYPTLSGRHGSDIDSPAEVIAYGLENKVTHFAWVGTMSGSDSWESIVAAVESTSPNGHVACPKQYDGACE